jgi:hypothetical protein
MKSGVLAILVPMDISEKVMSNRTIDKLEGGHDRGRLAFLYAVRLRVDSRYKYEPPPRPGRSCAQETLYTV